MLWIFIKGGERYKILFDSSGQQEVFFCSSIKLLNSSPIIAAVSIPEINHIPLVKIHQAHPTSLRRNPGAFLSSQSPALAQDSALAPPDCTSVYHPCCSCFSSILQSFGSGLCGCLCLQCSQVSLLASSLIAVHLCTCPLSKWSLWVPSRTLLSLSSLTSCFFNLFLCFTYLYF